MKVFLCVVLCFMAASSLPNPDPSPYKESIPYTSGSGSGYSDKRKFSSLDFEPNHKVLTLDYKKPFKAVLIFAVGSSLLTDQL